MRCSPNWLRSTAPFLTLRYLDDLPVGDVAATMGRTIHATEALLTRAKAAYRNHSSRTTVTGRGPPMTDPFEVLRITDDQLRRGPSSPRSCAKPSTTPWRLQ